MCGLLAYAGNARTLTNFDQEFAKLRHRGPDDTEVEILGEDATICFHRLAIMDPSQKGHQPFVDDATGNVVICNGEIYNHKVLKQDYELNRPAFPGGSNS